MLKVVENCRPAVSFARVLLICSLFAIGFASTARADEYQYTITFDPSGQSGLSMSATFLAGMLPGGLGTIVPASVQILNAPAWYSDPYGANIAVTATSVGLEIDTQTCPGGCDNIVDYLKPQDIGHVSLPLAITGPGTYQFGLDP